MDSSKILTLVAVCIVLGGAVVPALSLDLVAILALSVLVLGGVLLPGEAVHGFGSTTLIVVASMFVLAEALQRTGAAQGITTLVENTAARGQRRLLLALLPVVMLLSGIMNNTGVVVLLLPLLVATCHEIKLSPSRLLLPLSYASIMGGTLTLVGTTTTLLVDGIVRQRLGADAGIAFFEILPIGLVFCAVGVAYLVFVGPRLLPNRTGLVTAVSADATREYMTGLLLENDSKFIGRKLTEFPELLKRMRVLQLIRGEEMVWPPLHEERLQADDVLLVKGRPEALVALFEEPGLSGPEDVQAGGRVAGIDVALAEVMVAPRSALDHLKVSEARFRDRFGVVVLAVMRHGEHLRHHLGALRLRVGDILLVQGEPESIGRLARNERDLVLLGGTPPPVRRKRKAPIALAATALALGASALGAPLSVCVLLAGLVVVSTGCLTSSDAYRSIDLRIIVVLGCMLGVGAAASKSGLATDIADQLLACGMWVEGGLGSRWEHYGVLAMIYLTTAILTEIVTNAGTAAIMVPIALETAERAEVSHRPFVFAVALAASCSFLTPIGYQTNLLVYGPGGYRLRDYLRLGTPLVILFWILAVFLLPIIYPF
ncbi:MAG: SLC13 family permease [Planctomycetota bacterium]|nr:SLC13 family permease [Planctomycetota bacterium]